MRDAKGRHMTDPASAQTLVFNHLLDGLLITPLEALNKYGSFRLADIIFNIRKVHGDDAVITEMVKTRTGKKHARYRMSQEMIGRHRKGK